MDLITKLSKKVDGCNTVVVVASTGKRVFIHDDNGCWLLQSGAPVPELKEFNPMGKPTLRYFPSSACLVRYLSKIPHVMHSEMGSILVVREIDPTKIS